MRSPSRRALLASFALAVSAGCVGDSPAATGSDPESEAPTGSTASPPDGPETPPSTETERGTVGTGRNPRDVQLRNEYGESLTVTVAASRDGETTFERTVELAEGESRTFDPIPRDAAGTYVITIESERTESYRYEWDLDERSEDGCLALFVETDGTIRGGYFIA